MSDRFVGCTFFVLDAGGNFVSRVMGNIRKHGGRGCKDPFSPYITHIVLPVQNPRGNSRSEPITVPLPATAESPYARTLTNIVRMFADVRAGGRYMPASDRGPLLVTEQWVAAHAQGLPYPACKIIGQIERSQRRSPSPPVRYPDRLSDRIGAPDRPAGSLLAGRMGLSVCPPSGPSAQRGQSETATDHSGSLDQRNDPGTAASGSLADRLDMAREPRTNTASPNRTPPPPSTPVCTTAPIATTTQEPKAAQARRPSSSYVPRPPNVPCTAPAETSYATPPTPPLLPLSAPPQSAQASTSGSWTISNGTYYDRSRDPRRKSTNPEMSSIKVAEASTAQDTLIGATSVPQLAVQVHDGPTSVSDRNQPAETIAVNDTLEISASASQPSPSGTAQLVVGADAAQELEHVRTPTIEMPIKQESVDNDEASLEAAFGGRCTTPRGDMRASATHVSKKRRIAASPSPAQSLGQSVGAGHGEQGQHLETGMSGESSTRSGGGNWRDAPDFVHIEDAVGTAHAAPAIGEMPEGSEAAVERDLDESPSPFKRSPSRPTHHSVSSAQTAGAHGVLKRSREEDPASAVSGDRAYGAILRKSLSDLGLSVYMAAGHSMSLQMLVLDDFEVSGGVLTIQDLARLPTVNDPHEAFFIVLPTAPHSPVSQNHAELLRMVQRRRMGFAVSFRWLEECLRDNSVVPPAEWAVRMPPLRDA